MSSDLLRNLVLTLVPMVLSLTIHEFAHAWVATKLGDDTPDRQGRLTLSPLDHIDVVGTLLIPAMSVIWGGFGFIGWARPVQWNPANIRRDVTMRTGTILVAAAGPLSNLLLALGSLGALAILAKVGVPPTPAGSAGVYFAESMFAVNVGLFVLNMLPIPPLDGSRLLPRSMDDWVASVSRYSWIILLIIINVSVTRYYLLELPNRAIRGLLLSMFGFA